MKGRRKTLGIAVAFAFSLGLLLPLPAMATEPGDAQEGENYQDSQGGEDGQDAQGEDTYRDTRSGDNSLSALSISPGTLSPAFKYSVVNYTASVGADVTRVDVDAKTSNAAAKILSVTGNEDLQEGENTIRISVEAENGAPVTYQIVVTRGGTTQAEENGTASQDEPEGQDGSANSQEGGTEGQQDPQGILLNGHSFRLGATIPEEQFQEGFSVAEITCQGQQVQGLRFDREPSLMLVYLTTPSTEVKNTLAVYEEASGNIYPFRKVKSGKKYVIVLDPPADVEAPAPFVQDTFKIGKFEDVPVFTQEGSEFALVYAASSQGNIGWYQYDTAEENFQRYVQSEGGGSSQETDPEAESAQMQGLKNAYKDLEERYNHRKDSSRKTISVLLFLIAVLVIVILNLLLHRRRKDSEEWEEDEEPAIVRRERKNRFHDREKSEESLGEEPAIARQEKKSRFCGQEISEEGLEEEEGLPASRREGKSRFRGREASAENLDGESVVSRREQKDRFRSRGESKEGMEEDIPKGSAGAPDAPGRQKQRTRKALEEAEWQEEDPVFAEMNPRSRRRMQEQDDWDQKNLDSEKEDWDQPAPAAEGEWDEPKPKRVLNETAELKLDDGFEVINLEDL